MLLKLHRYGHVAEHSTGGALSINKKFICHTVEDEPREVKVPGRTRIPAGMYEIKLRTEGGMHNVHSERYPWHEGMLWLQDVPGFDWIYIHPGNNEQQTEGCILVGYTALSKGGFEVSRSIQAYETICNAVYSALRSSQKVYIQIIDGDI